MWHSSRARVLEWEVAENLATFSKTNTINMQQLTQALSTVIVTETLTVSQVWNLVHAMPRMRMQSTRMNRLLSASTTKAVEVATTCGGISRAKVLSPVVITLTHKAVLVVGDANILSCSHAARWGLKRWRRQCGWGSGIATVKGKSNDFSIFMHLTKAELGQ